MKSTLPSQGDRFAVLWSIRAFPLSIRFISGIKRLLAGFLGEDTVLSRSFAVMES